jgi:predicted P-loop ATPase
MSGLVHGASPEAWDHFASTLGLIRDLLPVVSNPDAEISEASAMKSKGKTPSIYNRDGKVAGIPKWTERQTGAADIAQWKTQPDYGIALQTRNVRAIDIDVPDREKSELIRLAVEKSLGTDLPIRWRSDSGKQLLVFEMQDGEPWPKRTCRVDGGIVEWLGDGQQFIAVGRHPDGELYKWGGDKSRRGRPHEIPVIERKQAVEAFDEMVRLFGTAEPSIARMRRRGEDLPVHDDVADWLNENWECFDVGPDNQLFISCPFAGEHTVDNGPSSTAYFPAGTGGYQQGHFVCLHAHCAGRDDHDFKEATGFIVGGFDVIGDAAPRHPDRRDAQPLSTECRSDRAPAEAQDGDGSGDRRADEGSGSGDPADQPWPNLFRSSQGVPETSARNLMLAIAHPGMVKLHLAHDVFNDALMCKEQWTDAWRRFTDGDAVAVRVELEHRGFVKLGKELIRDCIAAVAARQAIDSAKDWLGSLRWDGIGRVDNFCHEIWGWEDTPYATAVSRYIWSALAGRVLQPGVRADMAPVLVGLQGIRKTTLIQMMAPDEEMYAEIRLDDKDDNMSRKLRGKLVGELEELRGLASRELEEIKAFISRRKEAWVPKFKEFENYFWRRNLFFGTTNAPEFLADPTGERRWLPGQCGRIDVETLVEWREQYWAEGAMLFCLDGVHWQDAERLAKAEHLKFKISDRSWINAINKWLTEDDQMMEPPLKKGYITLPETLAAVGVLAAQATRTHEIRAEKALLSMGFERAIDPVEGLVFRR